MKNAFPALVGLYFLSPAEVLLVLETTVILAKKTRAVIKSSVELQHARFVTIMSHVVFNTHSTINIRLVFHEKHFES